MATSPAFASTPRAWVAAVSTANTARDGTGTIADVATSIAAAGTRINRIVIQATGDPADSTVPIFLHNGTSYFLYDEFDIGNPAAASTTVAGFRMEKAYYDLVLPSGWKLAASVTVALTAGVINVFAHGADLT